MKITKKEFIEKMTSNNIVFLGAIKKLHLDDELECIISDVLNQDKTLLEHRTYTAKSNYIVSNTDSRLYFNQDGTYTFYKCEYQNNIVLICDHTCKDNFDGTEQKYCMYYLVV